MKTKHCGGGHEGTAPQTWQQPALTLTTMPLSTLKKLCMTFEADHPPMKSVLQGGLSNLLVTGPKPATGVGFMRLLPPMVMAVWPGPGSRPVAPGWCAGRSAASVEASSGPVNPPWWPMPVKGQRNTGRRMQT